ncbi:AAA family ATPase [Nocardia thailandica]
MTGPGPGSQDRPRGVLVLTGISAAGKSTVAQALAERLPRSAHVRGDTFRRMIVGGAAPMSPDPDPEALAQLRLRHRLTAATADAYAGQGFTTIVQDVLLGEHLATLTRDIRARPLSVIVLAPHPDVVRARERRRSKTGYGPDWQPEDLDRILREDTPRLGCWLDTSGQSVAEVVEEILSGAWARGRLD